MNSQLNTKFPTFNKWYDKVSKILLFFIHYNKNNKNYKKSLDSEDVKKIGTLLKNH